MKKLWVRVVMLISFVMAASSAHAMAVDCQYKVASVMHHPGGWVYANFASPTGSALLSWMQICNLNETTNSITANSCKAIFATLLTAKITQSPVRMWFDQPTAFSCGANPSVAWQNLVQATGWYFGPAIE
jgi:hypothetical protein